MQNKYYYNSFGIKLISTFTAANHLYSEGYKNGFFFSKFLVAFGFKCLHTFTQRFFYA